MNKFLIRWTCAIYTFSTFSIRFGYAQKENFSEYFHSTSAYADVLGIFSYVGVHWCYILYCDRALIEITMSFGFPIKSNPNPHAQLQRLATILKLCT